MEFTIHVLTVGKPSRLILALKAKRVLAETIFSGREFQFLITREWKANLLVSSRTGGLESMNVCPRVVLMGRGAKNRVESRGYRECMIL